jgi:hypothetical protein
VYTVNYRQSGKKGLAMDPTECLACILMSLREDDAEQAIEGMENLTEWLRKQGFTPNVPCAIGRYEDRLPYNQVETP